MEKLLALAQHLDISFIEDWDNYYFGVKIEDYEDEFETRDDEAEDLSLEKWVIEQDSYIDFENEVKINGDYYTFNGEEYLILTDGEANEHARDYAEILINDIHITKEIKESFIYNYIDMESAIQDILTEGRGKLLSNYDGCENEETINGETYYIYRTD